MISMRITGGPKLAKILAGLDPAKERGVLTKMLMHGGEPIRSEIADIAPREEGKPDIADNIVISAATKIQSPEAIGSRSREEGEAVVAVGPSKDFPYAIPLEFGHVSGDTFVSARPFVRPGFDAKPGEALKVIQEEIWAYIRSKTERSTTGGTL